MKTAFRIAFKSFIVNFIKHRVILMTLFFSVAAIHILLGFTIGLKNQMKVAVTNNVLGDIVIQSESYKDRASTESSFLYNEVLIDEISKIKNVKSLTTRVKVPAVISSERENLNVLLVGIDREKENSFFFESGKDYKFGKDGSSSVILSNEMIEKLQTNEDRKIVTYLNDFNGKNVQFGLNISDRFTSGMPSANDTYIFADMTVVKEMLNLSNNATSEIAIKVNNTSDSAISKTIKEINEILAKQSSNNSTITPHVYSWKEIQPFVAETLNSMTIMMILYFSIVSIAIAIPLLNSMLVYIMNKYHEFGILKSLGMKNIHIFFSIMLESFYILIFGVSLGTAFGVYILFKVSNSGIHLESYRDSLKAIGLSDHLYTDFSISNIVIVNLILILVSLLFVVYPAVKASKATILQAMSTRE